MTEWTTAPVDLSMHLHFYQANAKFATRRQPDHLVPQWEKYVFQHEAFHVGSWRPAQSFVNLPSGNRCLFDRRSIDSSNVR